MYGHNLVGIYASDAEAQRVKDKLIAAGVSAASIRISGSPNTTASVETREEPGFFAWLFGDAPEYDRQGYNTHLRQNRAVVSVHVAEQERHQRALEIMEEFHPLGLDDQSDDVSAQANRTSGTGQALGSAEMAGRTTASRQPGREEQVIPVVKEELSVGKRATEQHTRVRVYTVERPVEEQVTLRDERVTIERRPAASTAVRPDMPQERTIDVIERHETAVAEKRGRVAEEVVVRKEVTERPEIVRGKVQETRVEVDKEPAGGLPPKIR